MAQQLKHNVDQEQKCYLKQKLQLTLRRNECDER